MSERPLHQLQICDYPALAELWTWVQELSFVPDEFELARYQAHLSKPELIRRSEEIESLPSAECIANELADAEEQSREPRHTNKPTTLLQKKNGVVKIGKLMAVDQRARMTELTAEFFGETVLETGNYLYPPGGFKEWHTNMTSLAGWRMYIIEVDEPEKSFFRYVDPVSCELKTVWDQSGTINIFQVRPDRPFWHAVKSLDTYRWSKGFIIPDNWREAFGLG